MPDLLGLSADAEPAAFNGGLQTHPASSRLSLCPACLSPCNRSVAARKMAILCGAGHSGEAPTTHLKSPSPSTGASISIRAMIDRPAARASRRTTCFLSVIFLGSILGAAPALLRWCAPDLNNFRLCHWIGAIR